MIVYIKFAFDVLYEAAPMFEYVLLPIACFSIFLGGVCMIKELMKIV